MKSQEGRRRSGGQNLRADVVQMNGLIVALDICGCPRWRSLSRLEVVGGREGKGTMNQIIYCGG